MKGQSFTKIMYTDRTEEEGWPTLAEGRRGEASRSWFSHEKRIGPRAGAKTERGRRNRKVLEEGLDSGGGREIFVTEASDLQSGLFVPPLSLLCC